MNVLRVVSPKALGIVLENVVDRFKDELVLPRRKITVIII